MSLLNNNNIRLRALEPEDLDLLYKWENDTSLWQVGSTLSPYSRYILKEYISESHRDLYEQKQLRLMIERKSPRQTVGIIDMYDFDPHSRKAGVGILIASGFQRKGFATQALQLFMDYAFVYLKLNQLYAHIPVNNIASRELFTHAGCSPSGRLAEWLSTPEGYTDVWLLQCLRSKWVS